MSDDLRELAKECAGNWREFQCFHWLDRPEDGDDWCIFYIRKSGPDLLEQSNAHVFEGELKSYMLGPDPTVLEQWHRHDLGGGLDALVIRVYEPNTEGENRPLTEAFKKWVELAKRLEEYPCLDEEDFSAREYEVLMDCIEDHGKRYVREDAPEDWEDRVGRWLRRNIPEEVDDVDGRGPYPSEESVRKAIGELGLLDQEYAEDESEDLGNV